MPRKARNETEPGIYHVCGRGVAKQPVFLDDVDRETYLTILRRVVCEMGWRCFAYCLMENHIHLLIETRVPNLGRGMQRLHGEYAQAFNARHGRVGHLFQGRFISVTVVSDAQFWMVAAYIARNPVEAGLCELADDWRWSSHRIVTGNRSADWVDVRGLLEHFGSAGGDPLSRYRAAVEGDGGDSPHRAATAA